MRYILAILPCQYLWNNCRISLKCNYNLATPVFPICQAVSVVTFRPLGAQKAFPKQNNCSLGQSFVSNCARLWKSKNSKLNNSRGLYKLLLTCVVVEVVRRSLERYDLEKYQADAIGSTTLILLVTPPLKI